MTLDEIHNWVFDDLGFCGCGDPQLALEFLKSVLVLIRKRHDRNQVEGSTFGEWMANTEELDTLLGRERNPAMYWSYWYLLDRHGLIEHGSNVSGSWLTEKGNDILDSLLQYESATIIAHEVQNEGEGCGGDALDATIIDG